MRPMKCLKRLFVPSVLGKNSRLKTGPISRVFGFDRGTPIDRYYIESFLQENKTDIRGVVLEIAESTYTKQFDHGVTSFEVLHVDASNRKDTIIGDLTQPETLPEKTVVYANSDFFSM